MMGRKTAYLLLLLIVILISLKSTSGQTILTAKELAGSYVIGFQFGGSEISLNERGIFQKQSSDCTEYYLESGTFTISDGVIVFRRLKVTKNHHGEDKSKATILFDRTGAKRSDSVSSDEIFVLKPVKWAGRIYLIPPSELDRFTDAINLGLEPRQGLITRDYFGDFYLRTGDEAKEVSGKPGLPERPLSLLLSSPVTATIVNIEGTGEDRIATIDKGSKDGLRVGLSMVSVHVDMFDQRRLIIVSVEEKTAKVKIHEDIVFGEQLTTRYGHRLQFGP